MKIFVGLITLLVVAYILVNNTNKTTENSSKSVSKTFEISPTPTFSPPTTKPIPTNTPTIIPSSTSVPTQKSVDSPSLTIPENELIDAVNNYRQSQGTSRLNINEGLCQEARKRAQDLTNQNVGKWPPYILGHEPFLKDINDGTLGKLSGLTFFGENVASSNCKNLKNGNDVFVHNATQLVKECLASSSEHNENMLKPDWIYVCSSGQYPFYVQIFGK
ncbi:MAG: CAP domain-containing protein [Candidatus Daviesbacteria bacterium]